MKSLLSVIWKYKVFSFLFILVVAIFLYIINYLHTKTNKKQIKYTFSLILFIISVVLFLISMTTILSDAGLSILMVFVMLFSAAIICLCYSLMLDICKPNVSKKKKSDFNSVVKKFDRLVEKSRRSRS